MITARKIKVTGCLNCPYLFKQELPDNKYIYKCHHPSFQLCNPQIPFKVVEDLGAEMDEPTMFPTSSFPDWCPLEMESVVCSCNPVKFFPDNGNKDYARICAEELCEMLNDKL